MPATRSRRHPAVRHGVSSAADRLDDALVIEAPLEVRCNGDVVATTMRTPGHDHELAVGFCLSEGYLSDTSMTSVETVAPDAGDDGSIDAVDVATDRPPSRSAPRLGTVSSSCGVCGSPQLAEMTKWCTPHLSGVDPLEPSIAASVSAAVREQQTLFDATGGTHAAAVFDRTTGDVGVVREDIGRHNAVDKAIGAAYLATRARDRPTQFATEMAHTGLWISGRASFEMMQKAWAAGLRTVVSVSAVSALASDVAAASDIELIGFARGEQFTTYHRPAGPNR